MLLTYLESPSDMTLTGGKKAAIKRAKASAIGSACLLFNG
jgi:hypothetical protein